MKTLPPDSPVSGPQSPDVHSESPATGHGPSKTGSGTADVARCSASHIRFGECDLPQGHIGFHGAMVSGGRKYWPDEQSLAPRYPTSAIRPCHAAGCVLPAGHEGDHRSSDELMAYAGIPERIRRAAREVGDYFRIIGTKKWKLFDIQSRDYSDENPAMAAPSPLFDTSPYLESGGHVVPSRTWEDNLRNTHLRPLSDTERRLVYRDDLVQRVINQGGDDSHIVYSLIIQHRELKEELRKLLALTPRVYELPDGKTVRWDAPTESIPIVKL